MSSKVVESHNPHDPSDLVGQFEVATKDDVLDLVGAAQQTQHDWARAGAAYRADALSAVADVVKLRGQELEDLIVREVGKPRAEARGEVARAAAIIRFYAQAPFAATGSYLPGASAGGSTITRRRPLGVAGLITPWNFPLAIPVWKSLPALAAGNAVVLKPSPDAAGVAALLGEILTECLSTGLFAVAHGEAATAEALIDASDVVSFTGSTHVGRSVISRTTANFKPVQAEMGGHNVSVVLPDADVDAVARVLVPAVVNYAGQKCTATRRIVVVGPADRLVRALRSVLADVVSGDPDALGVAAGPVINEQSKRRVDLAIEDAIAGGAEPLHVRDTYPSEGWYVTPTILLEPDHSSIVMTEEVFGPVASIMSVESIDDAIREANRIDLGLVSSVHGRDMPTVHKVANALESGMVRINAPTTGVDFHSPFGGDKGSSFGARELGATAVDFFSKTQTVTTEPPD